MANDYQKQYIDLKGGLDYSSSALNANPGSLSQCLNFETTDYVGLKRIHGFERFDGTDSPSQAVQGAANKKALVPALSFINFEAVQSGGYVILDSTQATIGTIVNVVDGGVSGDTVYFVESYPGAMPSAAANITLKTNNDVSLSIASVSFSDVYVTLAATAGSISVEDTRDAYEASRDRKTKFTQSRIAHGLHYFKNRLWAIVDFESILVNQSSTNADKITVGTIYPGDVLYNGSSSCVVLDVKVLTGAWAQSNLSGNTDATVEAKLLIQRTAGTSDPLFDANTELGVKRNNAVIGADAMTVKATLTVDAPDTWGAGLYYSQSEEQASLDPTVYGWRQYTHPWEFTYENGNPPNDQPPIEFLRKYREANFDVTDAPTDTGFTGAGTGVGQGVAPPLPDVGFDGFVIDDVAKLATDDANFQYVYTDYLGGISAQGNATMSNFSFADEIPEDALITGIEIKVKARRSLGAPSGGGADVIQPYLSVVALAGAGATSENKGGVGIIFPDNAEVEYTFGGQYDKWGLPNMGATEIRSADFGASLSFAMTGGAFGSYKFQVVCDVNLVTVKVYYTKPSTTYYFYNGTNDVSAKVLRVHTAKGSWASAEDKATGSIIVTDVVGNSVRNNIQLGDQMRTDTAGGGELVCEVTSHMVVCATASLSQLLENASRVQSITANFYGDADWNAMYTATGASRAFSFDGTYFQKIYTGVVLEKDKPRHVRAYRVAGAQPARLALAFPSGNVSCSVPGQPENFNGVDGAVAVDIGSRITGMANMQGTTLGVFCESYVVGIQGLEEQSPLVTLRPKGGAIEYTVQEVGNDVLFCDVYGIHALSQTDMYGDFVGMSLSQAVNAWLQPRLTKFSNGIGQQATLSVVHNSLSIRSSNQYRLYFGDGYVLTTTFRGREMTPEFTMQRYSFDVSGTTYSFVPIALCSEIDEDGRERRFMSHYAYYSSATSTINTQDRKRYVFEMDAGWSFDGVAIPCSFTPYYDFFDQQYFAYKTLRKVRAYGLSRNLGSLTCYSAEEFEDAATTNGQAMELARNNAVYLLDSYVPQTDIINVASRGICTRIKFEGSTTTVEPPYIVQGLLLQYNIDKGDE